MAGGIAVNKKCRAALTDLAGLSQLSLLENFEQGHTGYMYH